MYLLVKIPSIKKVSILRALLWKGEFEIILGDTASCTHGLVVQSRHCGTSFGVSEQNRGHFPQKA